jgi:Icc-related predicted phosphoesterase
MTKIAYCSDLHLEFGRLECELPDADILLLAGDIYVNDFFNKYDSTDGVIDFFTKISKKYKHIIYTPGNHEYYDSSIFTLDCDYFDFLNSLGNIHYSDNSVICIDDVLIIFSTMWTDMNRSNPVVLNSCKHGMSDYRKILYSKTYFTPEDSVTLHELHRGSLIDNLYASAKNRLNHSIKNKIVVMTHHAPSMASTHCKNNLDYAYGSTDLDDIIIDSDIQYWIHGHTHSNSDYMVGNTRVLSNCRGYVGYEKEAYNFEIKVIDV